MNHSTFEYDAAMEWNAILRSNAQPVETKDLKYRALQLARWSYARGKHEAEVAANASLSPVMSRWQKDVEMIERSIAKCKSEIAEHEECRKAYDGSLFFELMQKYRHSCNPAGAFADVRAYVLSLIGRDTEERENEN